MTQVVNTQLVLHELYVIMHEAKNLECWLWSEAVVIS